MDQEAKSGVLLPYLQLYLYSSSDGDTRHRVFGFYDD